MSKYKVEFTPESNQDLEEIFVYLAQFYSSTVQKFKSALIDKINSISENPYICQVSLYDSKYRRAVINDYVIYYGVNDNKLITIYLVLHSSRDVEKYLLKLKE